MEVVAPVPELHLNTAMNTPYISAPSSPPNHFADNSSFFEFKHRRRATAPNSPTSSAAIYAAFRKTAGSRYSSVPYLWEEKPGTPKSPTFDEKYNDIDLDFSFGSHIDKVAQAPPASPEKAESLVSADELFESGRIRPLKPPPRLYSPVMGEQGPKSPRRGGFLTPLRRGRNQRGKELDPFVQAMVEATRSRRGSRSLSPFGGRSKEGTFLTPPITEKGGRGWRCWFKELLFFRSSSEGRRASGDMKKNDFLMNGSLSSSSSASLISSVDSGKGKTGFETASGGGGGGGGCEENGSNRREAEAPQEMESTEGRALYRKRTSIVRSFNAGKFGMSFIRRRT